MCGRFRCLLTFFVNAFITSGLLGEAPTAGRTLPAEAEEEEEEPALDDMQRRLEALKS